MTRRRWRSPGARAGGVLYFPNTESIGAQSVQGDALDIFNDPVALRGVLDATVRRGVFVQRSHVNGCTVCFAVASDGHRIAECVGRTALETQQCVTALWALLDETDPPNAIGVPQ